MKKTIFRFLPLILVVLLTFSSLIVLLPAREAAAMTEESGKEGQTQKKYVDDGAELLTEAEYDKLCEMLETWSNENDFDIVVLTRNGRSGKTMEVYANDYYDQMDGSGQYVYRKNGIILFIDMSDRSYYESGTGTGRYLIDNTGVIEAIESSYLSYLSDAKYYKAFNNYFTNVKKYYEKYLDGAEYTENTTGKNQYDGGYVIRDKNNITYVVDGSDSYADEDLIFGFVTLAVVSVIAAIIVSAIIVAFEKKKMNGVVKQTRANIYERRDSFVMRESRDVFLYKTVSKVRINTDNNRYHGGHSSGSHSSHSSHSSGGSRSHSGRGGHF